MHSVQGCNIMQRDPQEPDEISHEHLHLENSIFNTTTYSRVCFQELYISADYEGKFATEIASLSKKCCCTVIIPHIWKVMGLNHAHNNVLSIKNVTAGDMLGRNLNLTLHGVCSLSF